MPQVPHKIRQLFSKAIVICAECGERASISNYFYHDDSTGKWWAGWYVCETPWCYDENFCHATIRDDELPSRKPFSARIDGGD